MPPIEPGSLDKPTSPPSLSTAIRAEASELKTGLIRNVPGTVGQRLRYSDYKRRLKRLGRGVVFGEGVYIVNPNWVTIGDQCWIDNDVILLAGPPELGQRKFHVKENAHYAGQLGELKIGRGCHIAPFSLIQAHGGVEIGDYTGVASGSKVYSLSNHYRNLEIDDGIVYKFSLATNDQYLIVGAVRIADNAALGLNSVVLPGVTIGRNSWVGASSLVVDDVPPDSIASGIPARVTKHRFRGLGKD